MAFLAFDVIFLVLCVAVASLIAIAVCCCLPCIIAVLYALAEQVSHKRPVCCSCVYSKVLILMCC